MKLLRLRSFSFIAVVLNLKYSEISMAAQNCLNFENKFHKIRFKNICCKSEIVKLFCFDSTILMIILAQIYTLFLKIIQYFRKKNKFKIVFFSYSRARKSKKVLAKKLVKSNKSNKKFS